MSEQCPRRPELTDEWILADVLQVIENERTVKAVVIGQKPGSDDKQWDELLRFQQRGRLAEIVSQDHLIPANLKPLPHPRGFATGALRMPRNFDNIPHQSWSQSPQGRTAVCRVWPNIHADVCGCASRGPTA